MKDITNLTDRFNEIIQEMTVYISQAESSEKRQGLLNQEEIRLRGMEAKIEADKVSLAKEREDIDEQKAYVEEIASTLTAKELDLNALQVALNSVSEEDSLKRAKLAREMDELEVREVQAAQQVEIDRKRKEVLDFREEKLRVRIKQLLAEGEIEVP